MRIAVMGAGGVGGCLGALLAQSGADVTLVSRGENLCAMQQKGIQLFQPSGSFTVPDNASGDSSQIGPVDLVLFAVKTYQIPEAVQATRPMIGPNTQIVTLQTGWTAPMSWLLNLALAGCCLALPTASLPSSLPG